MTRDIPSKVCPKCQKMNLKDAEFCENCGYDFNKKDLAFYKALLGF